MDLIDGIKTLVADGALVRIEKASRCEIDLYQCFDKIDQNADQLEVEQIEKNFSNRLIEAVEGLIRVRKVEQKLSRMVTKAMAFEKIDDRREELIKEILEMV